MDFKLLTSIKTVVEEFKGKCVIEISLDDGTILKTSNIKFLPGSESIISFIIKVRDEAELVYVSICHIHHIAIKSSQTKKLGFAIEKDISSKE